MPQIDLITGFLGSGKTTFIKKYAKFLIDQGLMVGILENDYGAINIDMMLLQDLMGDNCDVEMIVGGDGILSHRRRFQTKLISMAMTGYDRVIVEPSGIYDTDEFFDALEEEPLRSWYSPGSIISIVDAQLAEELSEETEYLLVSQTANAGKVLLSHLEKAGEPADRKREGQKESASDGETAQGIGGQADASQASEEAAGRILDHLNRAMERFHCDRRLTEENILAKDWNMLTAEDFAGMALSGMIPADHVKLPVEKESGYGTLFYYGTRLPEAEIRSKVEETLQDLACGNVLRIKGFVRIQDGDLVQINATRNEICIEPSIFAREVLIVTGENLHREQIDAIWAPFSEIITPGA